MYKRIFTAGQWLFAAGSLHLLANTSYAQMEARLPGDDNGVVQWFVMAGVLILFGAVVFMNPKRSHMD